MKADLTVHTCCFLPVSYSDTPHPPSPKVIKYQPHHCQWHLEKSEGLRCPAVSSIFDEKKRQSLEFLWEMLSLTNFFSPSLPFFFFFFYCLCFYTLTSAWLLWLESFGLSVTGMYDCKCTLVWKNDLCSQRSGFQSVYRKWVEGGGWQVCVCERVRVTQSPP